MEKRNIMTINSTTNTILSQIKDTMKTATKHVGKQLIKHAKICQSVLERVIDASKAKRAQLIMPISAGKKIKFETRSPWHPMKWK